jgi:hypothetical protein
MASMDSSLTSAGILASVGNEENNINMLPGDMPSQQPTGSTGTTGSGRPRLRFDLSTAHGKERMMALANALLQRLSSWKKSKSGTAVQIMNDLNKLSAFQMKGQGALSKSTAELKLNEIWIEAQTRREAILRGDRVEQDEYGQVLDAIWFAHEGQQLEVHVEQDGAPPQSLKRPAESPNEPRNVARAYASHVPLEVKRKMINILISN